MKRAFHIAAASTALITIGCFWLSTVISEVTGDHDLITAVKTGILYGMAVLIPSMATAGVTGASLGRGWKLPEVARKAKRMKIVAANGLLILLPGAVFLAMRAQAGLFDGWFVAVQALELLAGAANIGLMVLNLRDGRRLAARRRPGPGRV